MAKEADVEKPQGGIRFGLPDDFEATSSAASGPTPGSPKRKSPDSDITSGTQGVTFAPPGGAAIKASKPVQGEAAPSPFRFSQTAQGRLSPRQAGRQARAPKQPPADKAEDTFTQFTFAGLQPGPRTMPAHTAGSQAGFTFPSRSTVANGAQRVSEATTNQPSAGIVKQPGGGSAAQGSGLEQTGFSFPAAPSATSFAGTVPLKADTSQDSRFPAVSSSSDMPHGNGQTPVGVGPAASYQQGSGEGQLGETQGPGTEAEPSGSRPGFSGFTFGQASAEGATPSLRTGPRSAARRRGKPPTPIRTPAQRVQDEANMDYSPMDYSPYGPAETPFRWPGPSDTERNSPAPAFGAGAKLNFRSTFPNGSHASHSGHTAGTAESSDAFESATSLSDSDEEVSSVGAGPSNGFRSTGPAAAFRAGAAGLPGAFQKKVTLRPSPRRRKPASPVPRTGIHTSGAADEEHDSDGIANDFAGVHPFANAGTAAQPSMEGLFAAKVQVGPHQPGNMGSGSRSMSISQEEATQAKGSTSSGAGHASSTAQVPYPAASSGPTGESTSSFSFPHHGPESASAPASQSAAAVGGDAAPRKIPLESIAPAPSLFTFMTSGQPGASRRSPRSKKAPRSPSRPPGAAQASASKPAGSTTSSQQQSAAEAPIPPARAAVARPLFAFGSEAHQKPSGTAPQGRLDSAASGTSSAPAAEPSPFVFPPPPTEGPSKPSNRESTEEASTAASPRRFTFQRPAQPSTKPAPSVSFAFGSKLDAADKAQNPPVLGAFGTFNAGTSSTSAGFTSGAKPPAAAAGRTSPRSSKAATSPSKPARRASPRKQAAPGLCRMNGQPMPPPPAPGGAEPKSQSEMPPTEEAASRWTAYTAEIRASRAGSEQSAGAGAQSREQQPFARASVGARGAASSAAATVFPGTFQTPQQPKGAGFSFGGTPGPVPMSGMSFGGFAGYAASPPPPSVPVPQPSLVEFTSAIPEQGTSSHSTAAPSQTAAGLSGAGTASAQPWGVSSSSAPAAQPWGSTGWSFGTSAAQTSKSTQNIWGNGGGLFSGTSVRAPEPNPWGKPAPATAATTSAAPSSGPFKLQPEQFGVSGGPFQNVKLPRPYRNPAGTGAQPHGRGGEPLPAMPPGAPISTPRTAREKVGRRRPAKDATTHGAVPGAEAWQNADPNVPPSSQFRPLRTEEQRKQDTLSAVERLRQRANEKHTSREYPRAAALYKEAISQLVTAGLEDRSAVIYNNLAATNLQMGRPASALKYSLRALEIDPAFLKAAMRAATAHWRLGEVAKGIKLLDTVLQQPDPPQEAMKRRQELRAFQKAFDRVFSTAGAASTSDAVQEALVNTDSLLTQASHSRDLMSLKAHTLLRLNRVTEADKLAERQVAATEAGASPPLWPWWIRAQAAFLMGDLPKAASVLMDGMQRWQKAQEAGQPMPLDRLTQLSVEDVQATVAQLKELVRLKEAGNSAVKDADYAAAEERYSAALAACAGAPPAFAAVLHANRAAAHQAKGQLADAIADCLRAKALDPKYAKAHSRLAALLEDCRLYDVAVTVLTDLQALTPAQERAAVARRLRDAQASARRKLTPDHYKLLGLLRTCPQDEVRKVYKKLALRFHPDKALQQCKFATAMGASGARLATGSQIEGVVKEQASWLFQLIGAAHGVLSNASSRQELDHDLATDARRAHNFAASPSHYQRGSYSFRRSPNAYNYPGGGGYRYPNYDSDKSDDDGFAGYRTHYPFY